MLFWEIQGISLKTFDAFCIGSLHPLSIVNSVINIIHIPCFKNLFYLYIDMNFVIKWHYRHMDAAEISVCILALQCLSKDLL